MSPDRHFNAVARARTPTLDYFFQRYPHTELEASGSHVGLPQGFVGNSEVGHLNIGAGRVVHQDLSVISQSIEDGSFFDNQAFQGLFSQMNKPKAKSTLHLIGLVSDAGAHSHVSHLFALIQCAKKSAVSRVAIHVITDGRDTSPTSGVDFVRKLQSFCQDVGVGRVATLSGRFYAMDRDGRWERIEKAYQAIVAGEAERSFSDPVALLEESYNRSITDEFIAPSVARHFQGMEDGDGIIFFNFRPDRARQMTRAITETEFHHFQRHHLPTLAGFVAMTRFDESLSVPVAYPKLPVALTLGEVVSRLGWKQLRIAEPEKYAHVTYFFNGGEEKAFDGEKRFLIGSPREQTYELKPEMSARAVTDKLLEELSTGQYRFAVVNFANCDMAGHTGNLRAAVGAVEAVEECLSRIRAWVEGPGREQKAFLAVTSDHGNCEQMQDSTGYPLTAHTLRPVPFLVVDPEPSRLTLRSGGSLCDIAPTLLEVWGIPLPDKMTGRSLMARGF